MYNNNSNEGIKTIMSNSVVQTATNMQNDNPDFAVAEELGNTKTHNAQQYVRKQTADKNKVRREFSPIIKNNRAKNPNRQGINLSRVRNAADLTEYESDM